MSRSEMELQRADLADEMLYTVEDKPKMATRIILGIQQFLTMIPGTIAVPLIVARVMGLELFETVVLIQGCLLACGISTLIMVYTIGPIGGKMPIVMGTSFGFLAPCIVIGTQLGLPALYGAAFVGALFQGVLAIFYTRIQFLFPAVVRATVVVMIGAGLFPVGIQYIAGGVGSPNFGAPINLVLALIVIVITIFFSTFFKGIPSSLSILFGLVAGYVVALFLGLINFSGAQEMAWLAIPRPLLFWPWEFKIGAILAFAIMYIATTVETIGDVYATGYIAKHEVTEKTVRGSLLLDSFGSGLAALLNGLPNTSFSQNIGVIGVTKVASRHVVAVTGAILLLLGFLPKLASIIAVIPYPVLGGVVILCWGMIISAGVGIIRAAEIWCFRQMFIFGTAVAFGIGVQVVPEVFQALPDVISQIFGSGIVTATVVAIVLNLLIPHTPKWGKSFKDDCDTK